jgi:hypothetical protein
MDVVQDVLNYQRLQLNRLSDAIGEQWTYHLSLLQSVFLIAK